MGDNEIIIQLPLRNREIVEKLGARFHSWLRPLKVRVTNKERYSREENLQ
jgi:hypothetical protein